MHLKTNFLKIFLRFFLLTVFVCFSKHLHSQEEEISHKPSLTLGLSTLKFSGDVGKETDVSPLRDARFGYYFAIEQRIGKVLGISLGGLYGKLAGNDNSEVSKRNFQSTILQGELLITANFDKVFKEEPNVSPFLNAGVGFMTFDSYGDLKNATSPYYYWADGSIRDKPDLPINKYTAKLIKRDYTYESQLKDSTTNYPRNAIILPFGGGFNFHFGERWVASIGANYVMCLSDYVDNYKNGSNDSYIQANVGLQFEFRKKKKSKQENVDFEKLDHEDSDKDGVEDAKDLCMGTPKGVKIDENGCPLDKDLDGVPDYLDKEKNSKPDALVDENGVTINENAWLKKQEEKKQPAQVKTVVVESTGGANELASSTRNTSSNSSSTNSSNASSNSESSGQKSNTNSTVNKTGAIPADFISADYNRNGVISADEITRAIDEFFEGLNDFTAEKINQLIDYFFEQ
jgi:hypothetical protein